MAKPTHAKHPDHTRTTASKPVPASKPIEREAHHAEPTLLDDSDPINALWLDMRDILLRTDGWLRVVPDENGKVVWYKWKFTRGTWQGHYVMVRGDQYQHGVSLRVLRGKLEHVDLGYARPTKDSYFE